MADNKQVIFQTRMHPDHEWQSYCREPYPGSDDRVRDMCHTIARREHCSARAVVQNWSNIQERDYIVQTL